MMIKIDFRKVVGEYSLHFCSHDSTTPWHEWNMYIECCKSLNVPGQPNINRYLRYRAYLKEVGILS